MFVKPYRKFMFATRAIFILILSIPAWAGGPDRGGFSDAWGPRYNTDREVPRHPLRHGVDSVRRWNEIALNASGLDHTPVMPGENRVFGEQYGPTRGSRASGSVRVATLASVIER